MKNRHLWLFAYFGLCAVMLVWPVYPWLANSITPYVLGLPLSFAWNIGWIVLTFVVLGVFHITSGGEEAE